MLTSKFEDGYGVTSKMKKLFRLGAAHADAGI